MLRLIRCCFLFSVLLGCWCQAETPPGAMVIFGASGDVTARKLMPSLYHLDVEGQLSDETVIVGLGRTTYDDASFRKLMREAVSQHRGPVDEDRWRSFERKLFYRMDVAALAKLLNDVDVSGNRVFYLATPPSAFVEIIEELKEHGLVGSGAKVVLEKPFGYDLESAIALQEDIDRLLEPEQVYRIDHYLGKEGVRNIIGFRFFSSDWNERWSHRDIEHVQITIAEEIGIGRRASLWESTGLLRDMVQNHLMQVLTLVAMERPEELTSIALHAEKIKLLAAVRPLDVREVIRGQYSAGVVRGENVVGYTEEPGVAPDSQIETFVAARLWIDNEPWQGVPFYICSGKRLAEQVAEVVVTFKPVITDLGLKTSSLTFRIQPNPGVYFQEELIKPVSDVKSGSSDLQLDAYDKLLYDVLSGDRSLYVEGEEQLEAWRLLTPLLRYWQSGEAPPVQKYPAGSWGLSHWPCSP